jgi:hypothetical protein
MNHLFTLKKQRNMPFHDLVQQHFQPEELQNIDQILDALEDALKTKTRNLTPAERKRYGSINEANKLFVNKVYDYCKAQPALCSPDVDWAEYDADYQDRRIVEARIHRLQGMIEGLQNVKILHDYDNYQNALVDYAFTQYKKDTEKGGYVIKFNELRQFFPRNGNGEMPEPPAEPEA